MRLQSIGRRGVGFTLLFMLLGTESVLAYNNEVYVYVRPDGSRLITDHIRETPGYRLKKVYRPGMGWSRTSRRREPSFQALKPTSTSYDGLIRRIAKRHGVDVNLVKSVVQVESAFNPFAVSRKGAMGLMQLMPATAKRFGVRSLFDPEENLDAGVRYLRLLLDMFQQDRKLALAGYNAGENAVKRYRGIPPFAETERYVRKVMYLQRTYLGDGCRRLPGGAPDSRWCKAKVVDNTDEPVHFSSVGAPAK